MTAEEVLEAREAGSSYRAETIDSRGPDGERLHDVSSIDPALDRALDRHRLRVALPSLDWRERLVLKRLFFRRMHATGRGGRSRDQSDAGIAVAGSDRRQSARKRDLIG